MNREKVKKIIADSVVLVGFLLMLVSLLMFVIMNDGVFFSTAFMAILFVAILLILPIGYIVLSRKKPTPVDNRYHRIIAIFELILAIILLICCINFSLISDFVQPLVLNSMTNILLIVSSVLLILGAVLELWFDNSRLSTIVSCVMILLMFTGIIWANTEGYKPFNDDAIVERETIFTNGEGGYATFRIPSIVALDHNEINSAKGYDLKNDIILATAEGRKDSSRDTGSIDLVGKYSKDGGKVWSELKVLLRYKDEIGKYGNPTPVLDRVSGDIIFPYMTAKKADKFDYKTFVTRLNIDANGDITVDKNSNIDISFKNSGDDSAGSDGVRKHTLMVGPGKSIQLKDNTLIIPASSGGDSFVMRSTDGGYTWEKGESAGKGNECEAVELDTGELCMVVRDNVGCCDNHFQQYQRLSFSNDGGKTWYKKTENTPLKASICMSSLDKLNDGKMLISYTNSFYTRVNLTIGVSADNGKTFDTTSLYAGPSGYSCITVDSENNVFVLAEIGKVNYNEELVLLKVSIK